VYIKMSSDSLTGLKQAFLDAESRVRFPARYRERPAPRILACHWDGAFFDGALSLNPNLNCLVGGKGTGKSTIIESIRHAFDLPIANPQVAAQTKRLLAETFPVSAKVSVLIEVADPQPTRYIVERTGHERPLVRNGTTGELIQGLKPTELMRPVVFGQKEVYETAERIETQLQLLDDYCAEELRPLHEAEQAEINEIRRLSTIIRSLAEDAANIEERMAELPGLRERKRIFDGAGLAGTLEERNQLRREESLWGMCVQRLDALEASIDEFRKAPGRAVTVPKLTNSPNGLLERTSLWPP
jgi:DNA repair ATPase RecN